MKQETCLHVFESENFELIYFFFVNFYVIQFWIKLPDIFIKYINFRNELGN